MQGAMTASDEIVPGLGDVPMEGFCARLERVPGHDQCLVVNLEGSCLEANDGEPLLEIVERCLRGGFDTFVFRLNLRRLSPYPFFGLFQKFVLYDGRMAFAGLGKRSLEAFTRSQLECFFTFAPTVEEALARCGTEAPFDAAGLGVAVDRAVGPDSEGLRLRFSTAPFLKGILIAHVSGVLDDLSLPVFEAKAREAIGRGYTRIVFNMNRMRYWSNGTFAVLLDILRAALERGGGIALVLLDARGREIFDQHAMGQFLRVFETVEESVEYVRNGRPVKA